MDPFDNPMLPDTEATDDDVHADAPPSLVLSAVWKSSTLGIAFMEGTSLRFAQIPDGAPEFRLLQSCKYQLNPSLIVAPSTSDPAWFSALSESRKRSVSAAWPT